MRISLSYPTSTPANAGVFIYLNLPRSLKNSIQYLAPSPTSTANLEPLFSQNKPQIFPPTAKPSAFIFHLYIYIYLLHASTKYFAHYPHHGYRWLI